MSSSVTVAESTIQNRERMSFEEYLARDVEGGLAEWINGEVFVYMSASNIHQTMVEFFDRLLGLYVQIMRLGRVHTAPYAMRATAAPTAREPDVMFIANENIERLGAMFLNGPADLIVEVVSDDSVARDRAEKFYEYQDAGVREYWIIDPRPQRQRADFYVLDAQGRYQPVPIAADGTYHSTVLPQCWLRIEWLWQDEPNALTALAELVGVEQLMNALQHAKP